MKKHLKLFFVLLAVVVLGGVLVVAQRPGLFKGQFAVPTNPSTPIPLPLPALQISSDTGSSTTIIAGMQYILLGSWTLTANQDVAINNFIVRTNARGRQYITGVGLQEDWQGGRLLGSVIPAFIQKKYYFPQTPTYSIPAGRNGIIIDLFGAIDANYTPIPENVVFDLTIEYVETTTGQSSATDTVPSRGLRIISRGSELSLSSYSPIGSPLTEYVLGKWVLDTTGYAYPLRMQSFCFDLNSGGNNTAQASDFNGNFILRGRDEVVGAGAGGKDLFSLHSSTMGNTFFDDVCNSGSGFIALQNNRVIRPNTRTDLSLIFAGTTTAQGKTLRAELGAIQGVEEYSGQSFTFGIPEVPANQLTF